MLWVFRKQFLQEKQFLQGPKGFSSEGIAKTLSPAVPKRIYWFT